MSADDGRSSIRRWRNRYRGVDREQRARLEGIRRRMNEQALGLAIEELGLNHEFVCLREVRVPVLLHVQEPDAKLLADWSRLIAYGIAARIAEGDDGVVRYPSRVAAMADFCACVARGDHRRAWAWRRFGLNVDGPSAAERVLHCLLEVDSLTLPALKHLAAAGTLAPVAAQLGPADWQALVASAISGSEVPVLEAPPQGAAAQAWIAAPASAAFKRLVRAMLARSLLAAPLTPLVAAALGREGEGGPALARTLVALIALETEPLVLWNGDYEACLAELARALTNLPPPAAPAPPAPAAAAPRQRTADDTPATAAKAGDDARAAPEPRAPKRPVLHESRRQRPPDEPPRLAGLSDWVAPTAAVPPDAYVPRVDACTEWGGLLFLLKLIDEIDLPRRAAEDAALAGLSRRWVMHALALRLVPVAPDDPAALAFCGLAPDRAPPDPCGEVDAAARAWLDAAAAEVVQTLHAVLPTVRVRPEELVTFVCRRRARVVADPGWIELHFELDRVEVEVRRAGLDLDPMYVPWIGAVVRFLYA
ncbi:hypothetical protein EV699_113125 [Plasticicumulans lactativorans]|uniref:Uncharacterized protein n=1 Tax=Plasticicumulans lactativorans TaxID=1133106 RepID=A0A4R2L5U4_9GAMM|nr:hypothetical protein [Plasticicumulans lactativorans]TCO80647.1 hypothetical protein EV699_113125 [Plasticicumulans lactativorans]